MTISLRPYQRAAINSIYEYFAENEGNPILALPTGTGKSVVIAEFVHEVFNLYPGQRVMMLTHVKELIDQNHKKLLSVWPTAPSGIYSAGLGRRDSQYPIVFAGIASVRKRAREFGHIDLILIDECHLVGSKTSSMYLNFINDLKKINPSVKVIGLSATPYRLGLGMLTEGDIFTDFCFDNTRRDDFNELIDAGFLVPLIPRETDTTFDLKNVAIRGGEYVPDQLQSAIDHDSITAAVITELVQIAAKEERRKWLIFGAGVDHAEHITDELLKHGVLAAVVHSKLSDGDRDARIAAFKAGKITALVNNNMMTTGHDIPDLDLIGMMRPTASPGLWVQMLGRGTRPFPGKKNCLVLDFAGNTMRLGPINDPVLPKKRGGGGLAPVKRCPICRTLNHASAFTCIFCGHTWPAPDRASNLSEHADTRELIVRGPKDSGPIVTDFKVDRIAFKKHVKIGKPASVRVDYHCGLRRFTEWVCFEHGGYPAMKAHRWWILRTKDAVPRTTEEALERISALPTPAKIRVWVNKDYPEVMSYVFQNGTNHGVSA